MPMVISRILCAIFIPTVVFVALTSSTGLAEEVSISHPIFFGQIDLHPGGDDIIIAAQNGSAVPVSSRSIVTGGKSGLLQVTSEDAGHVEIIYPASVSMTSGEHTIEIIDINDHSQYSSSGADVPGNSIPLNIHVGGKMRLTGIEENGTYSGSMPITLNFEANSIP